MGTTQQPKSGKQSSSSGKSDPKSGKQSGKSGKQNDKQSNKTGKMSDKQSNKLQTQIIFVVSLAVILIAVFFYLQVMAPVAIEGMQQYAAMQKPF